MSLKAVWSEQTAPKHAPTAQTIKVAAAPQSVKVALLEEFGALIMSRHAARKFLDN